MENVMKRIIVLTLTTILSVVTSLPASSHINMLLLAGPLQSYDPQTGIAVILGQNVPVGAQSLPETGYTVAVFGTINDDGSLNVSRISAAGVYVPGATEIFLSGIVEKSDPILRQITVGGVTVDALVTSEVALPPVGATVQLVGTQPVIGGVILAQAINAEPPANVTSASPLPPIGITGGGFVHISH
jgi:hypothetical protein